MRAAGAAKFRQSAGDEVGAGGDERPQTASGAAVSAAVTHPSVPALLPALLHLALDGPVPSIKGSSKGEGVIGEGTAGNAQAGVEVGRLEAVAQFRFDVVHATEPPLIVDAASRLAQQQLSQLVVLRDAGQGGMRRSMRLLGLAMWDVMAGDGLAKAAFGRLVFRLVRLAMAFGQSPARAFFQPNFASNWRFRQLSETLVIFHHFATSALIAFPQNNERALGCTTDRPVMSCGVCEAANTPLVCDQCFAGSPCLSDKRSLLEQRDAAAQQLKAVLADKVCSPPADLPAAQRLRLAHRLNDSCAPPLPACYQVAHQQQQRQLLHLAEELRATRQHAAEVDRQLQVERRGILAGHQQQQQRQLRLREVQQDLDALSRQMEALAAPHRNQKVQACVRSLEALAREQRTK